ncbi:MAG: ATP-binding protein [Steroidobacteraceae bacterium]
MKPAAWSLSRRLMSMLAAAMLLSWGASSLWVYHTAVAEADQLFDAALDHSAHAVLAVVRNEASELNEAKEGFGYELAVIDQSDQNDIVYQVRGPNGRLVFRSHGAPVEPLAGARDRGFGFAQVEGKEFRVFSLATELDAATIHVAQPLARRVALTRAGAVRLLAPGAALMLTLVLAVAWTVRTTTAPLVRYASALDELSPETDTSVDGSGLPRELQSVTRAVDGLLTRVHDSLLRERTLTADAAHELRTPLAALRLQAQVARRAKNRAESDAALDELLAGTDRAARMVDSVLTLARFDMHTGSQIGKGRIDVGRLAQLVIREFTPLAELRGISITPASDEALLLGDEDALAIALRNLLVNALRFARAQIAVEVISDGEHVTIRVRDDGPGFSEESRKRAFHRFFRGSEPGQQTDGAGLGLALVLRIVHLHSGTVQIVPGIDGGAGIELQFARL